MTNEQHRDRYWVRARRYLSDEWHRRTWYGKLWYPAWLAWKALLYASIAVIAFMVWTLVGDPIGDCLKAVHRAFGSAITKSIRRVRAAFPEVYHD